MSELWNTVEFANPKIQDVIRVVKDLKEAIQYLRTKPSNSSQGSSQFSAHEKQPTNRSNDNGEVFYKDEQSDIQNTLEDPLETLNYGNPYLVNTLPRCIKEALSFIMQFSSTSYQQYILKQALTTIFFEKNTKEGSQVNEQFLKTFDQAWQQLEFINKCQYEQANKYTALRETIQSYYPEKQIFNHLSSQTQDIPNVLLPKILEKHRLIKAELDALLPSKDGRLINKPLIKINQIREHLVTEEPCKNYRQFVNNNCKFEYNLERFLEKEDMIKLHENMVKDYEEMFKTFKIVEYEAYNGSRNALLF